MKSEIKILSNGISAVPSQSERARRAEFQDKRGRIACPYAMQVADMLSSFAPHYASQKELDANGGVCKKCAKKIKKSGAATSKRMIEPRAKMETNHHEPPAFDSRGNQNFGGNESEMVDTTDFDFDGVEEAISGISQTPINERDALFDAMEKIFRWCFSDKHINLAAVRFAVIGDNLYPEFIGAKSNKELAKQLGISRQVLSWNRANFQKHFGIKLKALVAPNRRNKGLTSS